VSVFVCVSTCMCVSKGLGFGSVYILVRKLEWQFKEYTGWKLQYNASLY